jgi:hypothetical protein
MKKQYDPRIKNPGIGSGRKPEWWYEKHGIPNPYKNAKKKRKTSILPIDDEIEKTMNMKPEERERIETFENTEEPSMSETQAPEIPEIPKYEAKRKSRR